MLIKEKRFKEPNRKMGKRHEEEFHRRGNTNDQYTSCKDAQLHLK